MVIYKILVNGDDTFRRAFDSREDASLFLEELRQFVIKKNERNSVYMDPLSDIYTKTEIIEQEVINE